VAIVSKFYLLDYAIGGMFRKSNADREDSSSVVDGTRKGGWAGSQAAWLFEAFFPLFPWQFESFLRRR